jgi:hypothetical protein
LKDDPMSDPQALPETVPLEQAAEHLHTSLRSLEHLSKVGKFPPIRRVGHKRLVLRQDLEEFIAGSWQPPEATNGR